jgi:hypothetical protein
LPVPLYKNTHFKKIEIEGREDELEPIPNMTLNAAKRVEKKENDLDVDKDSIK